MTDTAKRVEKIIVEHLGVPAHLATPKAGLIDDLDMDSLDGVELVMAAEEEFNVMIGDNIAERWITVQDAIDGIEKLTQ